MPVNKNYKNNAPGILVGPKLGPPDLGTPDTPQTNENFYFCECHTDSIAFLWFKLNVSANGSKYSDSIAPVSQIIKKL